MNVVITGATCFIGVPLTKELLNQGHNVYAVIRKNSSKEKLLPEHPNLIKIYADLNEYGNLSKLIKSADVGVALAWNGTRGTDRNNYELQKFNYENNMILLEQLIALGCKKILTAGSQAEYGPYLGNDKVTEKTVAIPNTEYGKYKLKFYEDAKEYCSDLGVTLIEPRFFSLYGPGDFSGTLIMSMLHNMVANQPCEMTECKQIWDFLYIDDAIAGLYTLISSSKAQGIYNFGSGQSKPLKEYVEQMAKITNTKSELLYGAVPYPTTGMVNTNPSVEKLKDLGWTPVVSFEKGVRNILKKSKNL